MRGGFLGHITAITRKSSGLKLAAALVYVTALGGCGGVEFEGKVFDYMGVSGDRQKADPRMAERAPLMVPPNLQSLPQPTEGVSVAAARQDWPDDPEKVRTRIIEANQTKRAEAEAAADPINPYAGKETLLDKLFGGSKTVEEPVPDVPEPDASDRIPRQRDVAQSRPEPITPHEPQAPLPNRNDSGFNPGVPDSYRSVSGGQNQQVGF